MPFKFMLVDDDVDVLKVLAAQLESMGCEALPLADSREAAQRVNRQKIDGAFVDVNMPGMDRFELTRCVRVSPSNSKIPIVMLTGHDDLETMRKGYQAGITFFLGKPFTAEKLRGLPTVARSAMLLERRRYARLPLRTAVSCHTGGKQFRSESLNISDADMLLEHPGGIAVGQDVELQFTVPPALRMLRPRARRAIGGPESYGSPIHHSRAGRLSGHPDLYHRAGQGIGGPQLRLRSPAGSNLATGKQWHTCREADWRGEKPSLAPDCFSGSRSSVTRLPSKGMEKGQGCDRWWI